MYARMEEADTLIANLMRDKDPILRRCAMYTIAMAYVGSGSNKANRKLLHIAVSNFFSGFWDLGSYSEKQFWNMYS